MGRPASRGVIENGKHKKYCNYFGGASSEYAVSLQSAYAVICNMDREKYNPITVGITQEGKWFYFCGETDKIQMILGVMRWIVCLWCFHQIELGIG